VWLFAGASADTFIDMADGFERHVAARQAHEGQTTGLRALCENWRAGAAAIGSHVDLALTETSPVLRLERSAEG
jgi:hypothetical protein